MKFLNILIIISCILSLQAQGTILKVDEKFKLLSNIHLVNNIPYKKAPQALIEIPAGLLPNGRES